MFLPWSPSLLLKAKGYSSKNTDKSEAVVDGHAACAPVAAVGIARGVEEPEAFLPVLAELSSLTNTVYAPVREEER